MNFNNPKITVIMSVFNGGKWLHKSISSILNQTYKDFEFIIINDGSTDESLEIIQSYANSDSRIIIHNKSNTGLADSLNKGIEISRGKWIARIDSDDISLPRRLELQYKYVCANPDTVFLGSGMIAINEKDENIKKYTYPKTHKYLLKSLMNVSKFPPHSSAFYSQKDVKDIGGYRANIKRGQDWDLWLRLSLKGNLACLPDCIVGIRSHNDQISHDNSGKDQIIFSRIAITDYWIQLINIKDSPLKTKEDFVNFKLFIIKHLNKNNVFAFQKYKNNLKNHLYQKSLINFIFSALIKPSFMLKFLISIFKGDSLPKKMAKDWSRGYK